MSHRPRFALRTIRHGRVKIRGIWFYPDEHHRAYDGRLDGRRYAFGLYWGPPNYDHFDDKGFNRDFVSLWGLEAAYRAKTDAEVEAMPWPGPDCIDGTFNWQWWHSAEKRRLANVS